MVLPSTKGDIFHVQTPEAVDRKKKREQKVNKRWKKMKEENSCKNCGKLWHGYFIALQDTVCSFSFKLNLRPVHSVFNTYKILETAFLKDCIVSFKGMYKNS